MLQTNLLAKPVYKIRNILYRLENFSLQKICSDISHIDTTFTVMYISRFIQTKRAPIEGCFKTYLLTLIDEKEIDILHQ